MARPILKGLRLSVSAAVFAVLPQFAHAQEYPIDGSNFTVACSGNVLTTGKPWGNYPTTVTGCVLAKDSAYSIGSGGQTFGITCKSGGMIEYYPGNSKVKYCTLALDVPRAYNTAGQVIPCKGSTLANFTADGKVSSCGAQPPVVTIVPPAGGNGGGTGGGTGGGGGAVTGGNGGKPDTITPSGTGGAIVVPGESGTLAGAGKYTWIAKTSPRPGGRGGFVYLGDGRASASYSVNAAAGQYDLWIRFDDDGKHAAGARTAEVWVNGTKALTWGNPSVDTKGWVNIKIGSVQLRAGQNAIVFTKTQTTSAAFVMDEFTLAAPGQTPK